MKLGSPQSASVNIHTQKYLINFIAPHPHHTLSIVRLKHFLKLVVCSVMFDSSRSHGR